ncbi:MAG: hypothetical protein J3R72DRAFT_435143 [Linnemannia gamsii]|nr:MAG: hypothetical protein J3R72DRAFT_435143 [Linnemannia gamsii]
MFVRLKEHEGAGGDGSGTREDGGKDVTGTGLGGLAGLSDGTAASGLDGGILGANLEVTRVDIVSTNLHAKRVDVVIVGKLSGGDPVVVARGSSAVNLGDLSDETDGVGAVGVDELDSDSGGGRGSPHSSGAGSGPGERDVLAGLHSLAVIARRGDGVGEVDAVGNLGRDGGSEGQSGGDDGLGEHCENVLCVWKVVVGW